MLVFCVCTYLVIGFVVFCIIPIFMEGDTDDVVMAAMGFAFLWPFAAIFYVCRHLGQPLRKRIYGKKKI